MKPEVLTARWSLATCLFVGAILFAGARGCIDGLTEGAARANARTSQHYRFLAEHERTEVIVGAPFGCDGGVGRHFTAVMWGAGVVGIVCCGPEVQRRIGMECEVENQ